MQTVIGKRAMLVTMAAALAAGSVSAQAPLIEQGRAALRRGDNDAAMAVLEKAVAQSPKDADAHYILANAYGSKAGKSGMFAAAKYRRRAKDEWEQAVALNPKHVEARFSLVEFYAFAPGVMGGSYDKAFEQAKEVKAMDPILGHRAFALVYTQQKKPGLAKAEYAAAIREQPNSAKAHGYFGQHLANVEKNYSAAFMELETAVKLDPAYMPVYFHLGRIASLASANLERGEEAMKMYVAYTPKENEPTLAKAHYFLGTIYEKEGKTAEAKESYETALRLNPSLEEASKALKRAS